MSERNLQILELDGHVPVGHYVYFPHPAIMGNLEGNKTPLSGLWPRRICRG